MVDSGNVDAAILAALRADAALMAAIPGGVYYAVAPPGVVNFGIVDRLVHEADDDVYGLEPGAERYTYLAKAVITGSSSDPARAAALRIRAVLDGNDTIAPTGYALTRPIAELEAMRSVEVDAANPDRRVQHWGGQYAVTVQRTT